jgi:hypothetical protein
MEIENRTWGHIAPDSRQSGAKLTDQKIAQVTRRTNTRIIASRDGYRIENKASHPRLLPTTWYDVLTEDGQKFTLTFSGGEEPQLIEAYPHRYSSLLEATAFSRNWNGPKDTYPLPDVTIESSSGRLSTNNLGRLPPNFQGGRVNLRSFWAKLISESGSTTNFEIANENGIELAGCVNVFPNSKNKTKIYTMSDSSDFVSSRELELIAELAHIRLNNPIDLADDEEGAI